MFENQVGAYAESALYRNLWNNTMENHFSSEGFTNLEWWKTYVGNYEGSAIYLTVKQWSETIYLLPCYFRNLEEFRNSWRTYWEVLYTQLFETTSWDKHLSINFFTKNCFKTYAGRYVENDIHSIVKKLQCRNRHSTTILFPILWVGKTATPMSKVPYTQLFQNVLCGNNLSINIFHLELCENLCGGRCGE